MSLFMQILSDFTPPIAKRIAKTLSIKFKGISGNREPAMPSSNVIRAPKVNPKSLCYVVGDPVVKIPVDRLRYPDGRAYTYDDHHFLQYYNDGLNALRMHYQNHQPKNIYEFFSIESSDTKTFKPVDFPSFPWLDETSCDFHGGEHGLSRDHGNQAFGPVSEEKLFLEAARLDDVLKSIKEQGFRPDTSDYVRGYFMLRLTGEWVFVVRGGLHRTAALVQLGFSEIDVKFAQTCPRFVEESDFSEWPMVKNTLISERAALSAFYRFF